MTTGQDSPRRVPWPPQNDLRPERLADLDRQIADGRAVYEAAKQRLRTSTADDTRGAWRLLAEILEPMKSGVTGDKALWILGRVWQVVFTVTVDDQVIRQHEALRDQARKLREAIGGG